MATTIQRKRGTTAQHLLYAGPIGEITVDTDQKTLVVQDGTTAGGHPLARQDLANIDGAVLRVAAGLDTDVGLSTASDSKIPSQRAVKSYVDAHGGSDSVAKLNAAMACVRGLGLTVPCSYLLNGMADAFNDTSGIGVNSGISYDAANKWFTNYSDSYWSNVSLLLHMDGTMTDSSLYTRTVTPYNITYSTTDYAFGTGGAMLNGSNGHIRVPFAAVDFATNDFTVEGFFKPTAAGSDSYGSILFDSVNTSSSTANFGVAMNSGRQLGIYLIYSGSSWAASTVSTNTLTLGTRYHIRFKRTGNLFTLEVNGTVWCSLTSTQNMSTYTDGGFNIGGTIDGYGPRAFAGAVDEFRITKDVARTDAVPIAAFPDVGGGSGAVTSIAFPSQAQPTLISALIRYQDVNGVGITLNNELSLKVSRDNGASWSTASLVEAGKWDANTLLATTNVSVSTQPSGSSIKYKLESNTTDLVRLRAIAMIWS